MTVHALETEVPHPRPSETPAPGALLHRLPRATVCALHAGGWSDRQIRGFAADWSPLSTDDLATLSTFVLDLGSAGLTAEQIRVWLRVTFTVDRAGTLTLSADQQQWLRTNPMRDLVAAWVAYTHAAQGRITVAVAAFRAGLSTDELGVLLADGTATSSGLLALAALTRR